jgi:hypothetical protein
VPLWCHSLAPKRSSGPDASSKTASNVVPERLTLLLHVWAAFLFHDSLRRGTTSCSTRSATRTPRGLRSSSLIVLLPRNPTSDLVIRLHGAQVPDFPVPRVPPG